MEGKNHAQQGHTVIFKKLTVLKPVNSDLENMCPVHSHISVPGDINLI